MKVKISATYDGGEAHVTIEENMTSTITGSGEPNTELETLILAKAYQIWEKMRGIK